MHNIRGVLLRQAIFWRQSSACVLQKSRRLFSDLSSDFIAAASFIIRRSLVYLLHRSFWPVDMPREVFFFCSLFLVVVPSFARVANPFCINVFSYILGGLMSAVCCPVGSPLKEPFGKGKGWDIPGFVVKSTEITQDYSRLFKGQVTEKTAVKLNNGMPFCFSYVNNLKLIACLFFF